MAEFLDVAKIEARWAFDNSGANPTNPSHPPKRVRYGEQTTNEMAILILDVLPAEKGPRPSGEGRERAERRVGNP